MYLCPTFELWLDFRFLKFRNYLKKFKKSIDFLIEMVYYTSCRKDKENKATECAFSSAG